MTSGWQKEKCLSFCKDMTCQHSVDKLKKPFPNMETGLDQFGADGSFCQFLILPISLDDFSTTQHRVKGNRITSIANTLELLEIIKHFPNN